MLSIALPSPLMAEKRKIEQMGLRLDKDQIDRLRAYANAHPMQPSLTRLIDVAIGEWLAAHEREVTPAKPKRP